jgi:probable F420-dependent oxidoreductase
MAEELGADTVWVPDHLCVPRSRRSRYNGAFPFADETPWFDCLTVLAAVAGATERVRLGTAVLVLPQRNPLELAKVTSSLDRLSDGRLRLGVGAGWFEEEIRVLGYDPTTRGRRLDEGISTLRDCWTGEVDGIVFRPTPAQSTIPILVGGSSVKALRRAAALGDGWIPDASIDRVDFDALAWNQTELAVWRRAVGRAEVPFEHILVVDGLPAQMQQLTRVARRAEELGFDELVIELPFEDAPRAEAMLAAVRETVSVPARSAAL